MTGRNVNFEIYFCMHKDLLMQKVNGLVNSVRQNPKSKTKQSLKTTSSLVERNKKSFLACLIVLSHLHTVGTFEKKSTAELTKKSELLLDDGAGISAFFKNILS